MSLLRKSLLAVVPVAALCVPFMAAAPAQAHEHWEHHEHYHYYPYHWYAGVPLVVAPSVVVSPPVDAPAPVTLYYRVNSISPWVPYGTFLDFDAANSMKSSLQQRGYDAYTQQE